jgi:hypothetical protein
MASGKEGGKAKIKSGKEGGKGKRKKSTKSKKK